MFVSKLLPNKTAVFSEQRYLRLSMSTARVFQEVRREFDISVVFQTTNRLMDSISLLKWPERIIKTRYQDLRKNVGETRLQFSAQSALM